jgi:hypothetical protein
MLAATTDFHYPRFLGVLTVFAAILAALFGWTITGRMSARGLLFFCHIATLLSESTIWFDYSKVLMPEVLKVIAA